MPRLPTRFLLWAVSGSCPLTVKDPEHSDHVLGVLGEEWPHKASLEHFIVPAAPRRTAQEPAEARLVALSAMMTVWRGRELSGRRCSPAARAEYEVRG